MGGAIYAVPMGKGSRNRRERAEGRRRVGQAPEPPDHGYSEDEIRDYIAQIEEATRGIWETVEAEHGRSERIDQGPLPRTHLIGTTFLEQETGEPGSWMVCIDCGARYFVDGIVGVTTSKEKIGVPLHVMPFSCPLCGSSMVAENHIVNFSGGGGIAASHPDFLAVALEELLEQLRAGELTAEQAVEQLRTTPGMSRLVRWIEARGATTGIVVAVLIAVLAYARPPGGGGDQVTPEQIEQIVASVVSELEDRADAPSTLDVLGPSEGAFKGGQGGRGA